MSFVKDFDAHRKYLYEILLWCQRSSAKGKYELEDFQNSLHALLDMMDRYVDGPKGPDFAKEYRSAYAQLIASAKQYYGNLDPKGKGNTQILRNNFKILIPNLEKHEKITRYMENSFDSPSPIKAQLADIYYELIKDQNKASGSFDAVRNNLKALLETDPQLEDGALYRRKLSRAFDSAVVYLREHRSVPYTKNGKKRVADISNLKNILTAHQNEIEERRLEGLDRKIADQNQKLLQIAPENADERREELVKLGRLQANIKPSRLTGRLYDFEPKPSARELEKGQKNHERFTGLKKILGTVLGGLVYGISALCKRTENRPAQIEKFDKSHIPGYSKGTNFETLNPEAGEDDQPLIVDSRRLPLVFEKEIPEDPNQGPTMSINICQDVEGEGRGVVLGRGDDGEFGLQMGHGFISLAYSKKDPLSGQLKRYKTTFGFYPNGGFLDVGNTGAMLLNGRLIPGTIVNDEHHSFTSSIKYNISNKAFNKVVLATQSYASGGYNYVTRNCTSFVNDMAKEAGIDVSKYFNKVDLSSNFMGPIHGYLGTFGSMVHTENSKDEFYKRTSTKDLSYQRFGQKLITEDEIQLLDKDVYNKRLIGYAPGHIANSMRLLESGVTHGINYKGSGTLIKDENDKVRGDYFYNEARSESAKLTAKLLAMAQKQNVNITDEIEKLEAFNNSFLSALEKDVNTAFVPKEYKDEPVIDEDDGNHMRYVQTPVYESINNRIKACEAGNKTVDAYIEGLNKIYHETFKSNGELNIPFMHMLSVVGNLKKNFETTYNSLKNPNWVQFCKFDYNDRKYLRSNIDKKRDIDSQLYNFLYEAGSYNSTLYNKRLSIEVKSVLPTILAYGSLEDGVNAYFRQKELNLKSKDSKLSKREKKELKILELKQEAALNFSNTQKEFLKKESFSPEEVKLFFCDLPMNENKCLVADKTKSASFAYQGMVFEKIFKKTKDDVSAELLSVVSPYTKELTDIINNEKGLDEGELSIAFEEAQHKATDAVCEAFDKFYMEKLMNDKTVLPMIMAAAVDRATLEYNKKITNLKQYEEDIKDKACDYIYEACISNYVNPIMASIGYEIAEKLPENTHANAKKKIESIISESYADDYAEFVDSIRERKLEFRTKMFGKPLSKEEIDTFVIKQNKLKIENKINNAPGKKQPEIEVPNLK